MSFRELLKDKLGERIAGTESIDSVGHVNLDKLPKGFQRIGDIIVLNLDKEFDECKKEIGKIVLELFKVRSVCNKFGEITGRFREPQIEVLAGTDDTVVTHIEHGIKYRFDIRKVMFAKGNLSERVRYPKLVKDGEVIVDMFAGLGYFSLAMGKLAKPSKIYSIEMNPISFGFLVDNVKLNNIRCVDAINGDCREVVDKLVGDGKMADRVLMGYLPPPKEFLPWALRVVRKGGMIHYEDILTVGKVEEESKKVVEMINGIAAEYGKKVELVHLQDVKSYGPKTHHYVFDLRVS